MTVRVRFAPSPTGYLHVGGARSALFNWLFARRHGGTFILRIEDTDRGRFVEGAMQEIYESLRWLGLEWDEGPGVEGACGPYIQSQRLAIYKEHADRLIGSGHAYRCFCTPERLTGLREAQEKNKQQLGYDRRCRGLSSQEADDLHAKGVPHVVRLKIPPDRKVVFNDIVRGPIEYLSDVLDDLVLLKTDGFPTYHLANVVDDHCMGITHVLRGDEWIASTPRHVLLYEAFGWDPPEFAHLPVILSEDGKKLSKRKGAASVMDYRRAGYLPEALFNFLSLLGWAPGNDREKMTVREIVDAFSIDRVSPKAAVFDEKKLEWMNGMYMAERPAASLLPEVLPAWKEKGWIESTRSDTDSYLSSVIDLLKVRSKKVTELVESAAYFFKDPAQYEEKAARKNFTPGTAPVLKKLIEILSAMTVFDTASLEAAFREYAESSGTQSGLLIHPTRLALTGVSFGPGLFELMAVLGKETVVRRMKAAVTFIETSKV